ncbi:MAG: RloB family protein [Sarcina sp.]
MARRKRKEQVIKNKVLIICQGKTEYNYFNQFRISIGKKDIRNLPTIKSKINDESPKRVVEYAIKERTDDCLSVWCVFDKDEFKDFEEAIRLAQKNGIKCAYSNKDFELWFLYHIKNQRTPIKDKACKEIIAKFTGKKYSKVDEKLYDYFEKNMSQAINNAKIRHQESIVENPNKVYGNEPCTTVYELVEYLNAFK